MKPSKTKTRKVSTPSLSSTFKHASEDLQHLSLEDLIAVLNGSVLMQKDCEQVTKTVKDELTRRHALGECDDAFSHHGTTVKLRTSNRWTYSDAFKTEIKKMESFQQQESLAICEQRSAWFVTTSKPEAGEP